VSYEADLARCLSARGTRRRQSCRAPGHRSAGCRRVWGAVFAEPVHSQPRITSHRVPQHWFLYFLPPDFAKNRRQQDITVAGNPSAAEVLCKTSQQPPQGRLRVKRECTKRGTQHLVRLQHSSSSRPQAVELELIFSFFFPVAIVLGFFPNVRCK